LRSDRGGIGNRFRAAFALHLLKFAHQLGALGASIAYREPFTDEAGPQEDDRKRYG
jgi:hypothetical protein